MSSILTRPRWPTSLWAPHIVSNLYLSETTNCNLLWSHLAQLPHQYRTLPTSKAVPFASNIAFTTVTSPHPLYSIQFLVFYPGNYLVNSCVCLLGLNPIYHGHPCGRRLQNQGTDGLLMTSIKLHNGIRAFLCGLEDSLDYFCLDVLILWDPGQCICIYIGFTQIVISHKIEFGKFGNPSLSGVIKLGSGQYRYVPLKPYSS